MADNETTADIIAEMRRGTRLPGYWRSCDVNEILQYHADRLEAAHRRELSKNTSKNGADFGQLGDAAKLREAVKWAKKKAVYIARHYRTPLSLTGNILELLAYLNAALAAPPRNCDMYPTFNDAIRALADKRGWHDAKWDSERYCILASWLFAPATEQEGGKDGNE